MGKRVRDAPRPALLFPIGVNSNQSRLTQECPRRDYVACFSEALRRRYPVTELYRPRRPPRDALFPTCAVHDHRSAPLAPSAAAGGGADESFATSALRGATRPQALALRRRLLASAPASPRRRGCGRGVRALNAELLLLLGVPSHSSPPAAARRAAARATWAAARHNLAVCFLLSSWLGEEEHDGLLAEQRRHGDLLFLDAPETPMLLRQPTRYSNFTRKGRGMPTFKQYAFFQHAARALPDVPWVGKIDDDTAPNVRLLLPLLASLRCLTTAFVGAINFAGVVPAAEATGVRADRCAFGWSLRAALSNFGRDVGTPSRAWLERRLPGQGYWPACDRLGAVLPFPYATGAGYFFSAALLRFVATSAEVTAWVADAYGPSRDTLQWQKFEDSTTGYWLSYSPATVEYVNIGAWVHDFRCHERGEQQRHGGGLYRPPSNATILVHNLKHGGFQYAAELMAEGDRRYDHRRCQRDAGAVLRYVRNQQKADGDGPTSTRRLTRRSKRGS
ncbi:hypothetical protein AB1Y20_003286 [Prymnesium parvum]|uniref:Hexosyltransferase n=1 Tax=Prymnesium parvum TaxID=97485 RepID=A0AB34JCK8_PRYPA